jgi:hypothetical protein
MPVRTACQVCSNSFSPLTAFNPAPQRAPLLRTIHRCSCFCTPDVTIPSETTCLRRCPEREAWQRSPGASGLHGASAAPQATHRVSSGGGRRATVLHDFVLGSSGCCAGRHSDVPRASSGETEEARLHSACAATFQQVLTGKHAQYAERYVGRICICVFLCSNGVSLIGKLDSSAL